MVGGELFGYVEPTFKTEDRTYKTIHGVNGRTYKYLLNNKLLVGLDFTVYRHNRRLITQTSDIWRKNHYKTNDTGFHVRVVYNFNGGKKVNVRQSRSIQDYYEYKDE